MFYKSTDLYEPGTIIQKGHWGQWVQGIGTQHKDYTLYRECLLEYVRKAEFPELPSRLTSAFVHATEIDAKRAPISSPHYQEHIYQVKVLGNPCLQFSADMVWVGLMDGTLNTVDGVVDIVRRYWRGEKHNDPTKSIVEVLLDCDIVIIRRTSEIVENGLSA